MKTNIKYVLYGSLLVSLMLASSVAMAKRRANDFPTIARVEYVIACLDGRGVDSAELRKCSCVVDTIATHLSYEDFLKAKALSALQQANTPNSEAYQSVRMTKLFLDRYLRAQAFAELGCF
jgi:hypothetical protein